MAISAFLHLEGQMQGNIKGGVTQKGREGLIEVTSWSWGAERDFEDGLPTGTARISEFHLTKERDVATPKLMNAFANNEALTEWQLDLYDPSFSGVETKTAEITLTGVRLASIRGAGLITNTNPPPDHDELTFVFQKIEFEWLNGGILGVIEEDSAP